MPEWASITLLALGPLLWMIGGTWWKPARRFVWPAVAGGLLVATGSGWWALATTAGLVGVNCLPYGDKTSWGQRAATFTGYALPGLFVGGLWWVTVPLACIGLTLYMLLSRRVNAVTWKTWEALAGLLQAMSLVIRS